MANFSDINMLSENSTVMRLPSAAIVFMHVNGLLIILLNSIVIICLGVRKHLFSSTFWTHLLFLSINDIIAGLSTIALSFIDRTMFSESVYLCSATLAFFLAAQGASLYIITVICACRLIAAKKANQMHVHLSRKVMIISFVSVWQISVVLNSLPFVLWTKTDNTFAEEGCSISSVFHENSKHALKMLSLIFMLPLLFTNLMYVGLLLILRKSWNRTHPQSDTGGQANNALNAQQALQGTSRAEGSNENSSFPRNIEIIQTHEFLSKKKRLSKHSLSVSNKSNSSVEESLPKHVAEKTRSMISIPENKHKMPETFREEKQLSVSLKTKNIEPSSYSNLRGRNDVVSGQQRRLYNCIGLILLFLNLFTLPGIVVSVLDSTLQKWSLNRGIQFTLSTIISCNAIVNPILYGFQVKTFRLILKSAFLYCFSKIRNNFRRHGA